jgi:AcrR family transcriptional regulator
MAQTATDTTKIDAILDAAADEFLEKGFAGSRVDEIARRAGINKAMLYYHVGDKEELFARVLIRVLDGAHRVLLEAVKQTGSPEQKLRTAIKGIFSEADRGSHMTLILREIPSGGDRLPSEVLDRLVKIASITMGLLVEGRGTGVFREVHPLLVHIIIVASAMVLITGKPLRERLVREGRVPEWAAIPEDQLADLLADIVLHGVSTGGPR